MGAVLPYTEHPWTELYEAGIPADLVYPDTTLGNVLARTAFKFPDHPALIFGIGFPPFRGGLLRYADMLGAKKIIEKLEACAKKYGNRFAPPASLIAMAKIEKDFHT
jgi:hypothetical protein